MIGSKDQASAVWRKAVRLLIVLAFGEPLHRPGAVGGLPKQILNASPARGSERHPLPVGCPDRKPVARRTEGEASQRLLGEIPEPDVVLLVAHLKGHARSVWGNAREDVVARWRRQRFFSSVPIHPHEPAHSLTGRYIGERAGTGDREVHGPTIRVGRNILHDGDRWSGHLQLVDVERHGPD